MKTHWLRGMMLAVSMALLLAGGVALAQDEVVDAGCGSATVDGRVAASEWANAVALVLYPHHENNTGATQDTTGTLYLMNDGRYLYVGATMDWGLDTSWAWNNHLNVMFEDEPPDEPTKWTDCEYGAEQCADTPGEGSLRASEGQHASSHYIVNPTFVPISWEGECEERLTQGVDFRGSVGDGAHYEMRIDLENSELNNVGLGDCFNLRVYIDHHACAEEGEPCGVPEEHAWADWGLGDVCTILCLNPCEPPPVEFVPEPGTIMLLGSGLMGLAGYATLRWRTRE